jgi:peptide/nickel transport system substrate-binding protein
MYEDKQYWKDFDHAEIVDKYTVKLILKQPDYTWFTFLLPHYTGLITSKKALEEYGVEGSKTHAIGTGPYELVEWIPMDKIELKRYDQYWGEKPSVEKIKFISFGDEIAASKALRAGQIDIMKPALESLESLRKEANIKLKQYSGGGFSWIGMNIRKAPLDNIKVRQAIAHAVDVDEILRFIRREIAEDPTTLRALSTIPAYFPEACSKEKCPPYELNLELSKKLLEEAGYPNGFTIQMGTPSQGDMDDVATILQRQLKKVGINLEVTTLDQNAFWDSMTEWDKDGTFPLFGDEWYGYVVAPIMGVMDFQCKEAWNLMKWCNEEFTQIVGGIKQTRTREDRIEKYHKLQQLMHDAYIAIFIDYGNVVWAYRTDIDMGRSLPNGYHLPQTMRIIE